MFHKRKTPHIALVQPNESGSTCLAMVAGYYNLWISLIHACDLCDVTKDGCFPIGIRLGAESLGFRSEVIEVPAERLYTLPCPAILHCDNNSYVVLEGVYKNSVWICNPAFGEARIPLEQFSEEYLGQAITIEKGPDFNPGGEKFNIIRFVIEMLTPSVRKAILYSVCAVLIAVLTFISPFFQTYFVDNVLAGQSAGTATPFLIVYGVFLFLRIIVSLFDLHTSVNCYTDVSMNNSSAFFHTLLRLPYAFFQRRTRAYFINCGKDQTNTISFLSKQSVSLFLDIITTLCCFIAVGRISLPLLGLILIMTFLPYFLFIALRGKRKLLAQERYTTSNAYESFLMEGLEAIDTIKTAGAEFSYFRELVNLKAMLTYHNTKSQKLETLSGTVVSMLNQLAALLIVSVGAFEILRGRITFGSLIAIQGIYGILSNPILAISNFTTGIYSLRYSLENLKALYDASDDVLKQKTNHSIPEDVQILSGKINLIDVSFGYSRYREPFIRHLNLNINPRECIAIVGESGCGKTTIKNLICGRLLPKSGEVLFDGKPISEIPAAVFSASVACVDQIITLFPDSITDNIKMWDESIEDFVVYFSSIKSEIHNTITSRPKGYLTTINPNGSNFSGGERQRIEIARALAQEPNILILDEATSALDAIVEKRIVENIRELGITTIVIAHRLSTIRQCDRIYVMSNGSIVESGTHDELIKQSGLYKKLVTIE